MRILITGNTGYIGPSVLQRLRQSYPQATLIGLDKGYFAHCLTNAEILPECRADVQYFADVRTLRPEVLQGVDAIVHLGADRKSTRLNSSHLVISYAVFCLNKKHTH